jgi:hypothetical protein
VSFLLIFAVIMNSSTHLRHRSNDDGKHNYNNYDNNNDIVY